MYLVFSNKKVFNIGHISNGERFAIKVCNREPAPHGGHVIICIVSNIGYQRDKLYIYIILHLFN